MRCSRTLLLFFAGLCVATSGCKRPFDCSANPPEEPGRYTCQVPGWVDRDFFLHLPDGATDKEQPLVLMLHGGGGKKEGAVRTTCFEGDERDDGCLSAVTDREGAVLVVPDGTSAGLDALRTWNAGGGTGNWRCVSGKACDEDIDDVGYFKDLLKEVGDITAIDEARIFSTGISNGGAMSHRLACELSDTIAAIAPVGGANQLEIHPGCAPSRPVPVIHFHGTADPCWQYEGGAPDCPTGQRGKDHIAVEAAIIGDDDHEGWVQKNGCAPEPVITDIDDDDPDDGTTTQELTFSPCDGDATVTLVKTEGGGHTWPDGWPYLDEGTVGVVAHDFNANERMWKFFEQHPMPDAAARDGGS